MINLIPQKAKKSILIEYWVRVISVWCTSWAIALFAGASILLPAYVLIDSQVEVYEQSAAEATQKVADYDNVSKDLVRASQQARVVITEGDLPIFSDYIKLFAELQGPDIQTSKVELTREAEGIGPVEMVGVAKDRQALSSFRDRLLANEQVLEVDFPISNLASKTDIDFTITVTITNNNEV